jgi:uncharacterized metal-binding protein YceD (DUF177 family)
VSGPAPEFSRRVPLDQIGGAPVERDIEANAAECAALAARFELPALRSLRVCFRLRRDDGARVEAEGQLHAALVRECVVSLEPFDVAVDETFRVAFVPEGDESEGFDPQADDEIPYAGGAIDIGEAAAEQLALSLDPYPHKPGVAPPQDAASGTESPFAVLARRRGDA